MYLLCVRRDGHLLLVLHPLLELGRGAVSTMQCDSIIDDAHFFMASMQGPFTVLHVQAYRGAGCARASVV